MIRTVASNSTLSFAAVQSARLVLATAVNVAGQISTTPALVGDGYLQRRHIATTGLRRIAGRATVERCIFMRI